MQEIYTSEASLGKNWDQTSKKSEVHKYMQAKRTKTEGREENKTTLNWVKTMET